MDNKKHYLSQDSLLPRLRQRILELKRFIAIKEVSLKQAPAGYLRVIKNHNTWQFYHITMPKDRNGVYIPRHNHSLVKALAQRDFDHKLLPLLKKQLSVLEQTVSDYTPRDLNVLTESFPPNRQPFFDPIFQPREERSAQWLSVKYNRNNRHQDGLIYQTSNGITVRSKSEVIIAELLTRNAIPFRYEFPVKLKRKAGGSLTVYPDFYCLNLRTNQEVIWEHFGLMENEEYAANAIEKINCYIQNGWRPGVNLITTFESAHNPMNQNVAATLLKQCLL